MLLANLLLAAWASLQPADDEFVLTSARPDSGSTATVPGIALLAEVPTQTLIPYSAASQVPESQYPLNEASVPAQADEPQLCVEFGPIATRQLADSLVAAVAEKVALDILVRTRELPPSYRVYLPPVENRDSAVENLARLRAALADRNLSIETFLIPRGDLSNGIALGLFSEQRNALNVKEQVEALGFPVILREEGRQEDEFWLSGQPFEIQETFDDLRLSLTELAPSGQLLEKLCQTIAQDILLP